MIKFVLLLVLAFVIIVALEVPALLRKKAWRELAAFSFFLVLGFALALPQVLGFEVPNPNKAIAALFRPLAEWLK